MAKTYPMVSIQNVRVKSSEGKTQSRLTQKVSMVNTRASGGVQTLFDLTTNTAENNQQSIMSVYSIADPAKPTEKKHFVKLKNLGKFLNEEEQSIEADQTLKAIFSENGLEIGPDSNAISMKRNNDQIVITVSAKDKKPYTIVASPTSISLEYGDGDDKTKYTYSTNNESCIDITVNRRVVKDMLSSKEGASIFSPVSSVNTLPANIIGEYFCGMKDNSSVDLKDITFTKLNFGADIPPCCFVKQRNSKGEEVRYLYVEGKMVNCKSDLTFLYEKDENGKYHYSMHIETSSKPSYNYQIPIPISSAGVTSPEFAQAYELLTNNSGLNFMPETTGKSEGLKQFDIPIADEKITIAAKQHDGRSSNPVVFSINERNLTVTETISPELYHSRKNGDGIVSAVQQGDAPDDSDASGDGDSSDGGDETPSGDSRAQDGDTPEAGDNTNLGESNTGSDSQPEGDKDEPAEEGGDGGESSDNGGSGGGNDTKPKPNEDKKAEQDEEDKSLENYIAEQKARNDEKNKAFKDTLKTVNNVMGETLSTIGIWLMVCSLIPGVGLLAMIPGAIMAGIGLLQSTFADKLVFSPFRRIKHKLDGYEKEQSAEFDGRENFLENERELDNLENASADRIAVLDKMHNKELSDNAFARDFAALYNANGIGVTESADGSSNIHNLCNLENLDTRLAMAMSLDQIAKTDDPKTRQALVEDFTISYFTNLSANQRASVEGLFTPENNENLRNYVAALNEANSAQIKERTLHEEQSEFVKNADVYRLKYLAGTDKMSEEQRIKFFERYGTDIIQNAILTHGGSTEVLNQMIENVPEESRDQVVAILNDAAAQINSDIEIIDKEAKANVEEHKKVDLLQEFKASVDDIVASKDKVTSFNACVNASEDYLKTYSLTYYDGYAEKLEDNVAKDTPASVTGVVEKNVLASVNETLSMLKPNKPSSEMAAIDGALNGSGYFRRVASLYTATSETGSSILASGGLLADPSSRKLEKSHTIYAVADTFAKNDLITFMVDQAKNIDGIEPEAFRAVLNKRSLSALVNDYKVAIGDDGKISMTIGKLSVTATADATAISAAKYSIGRVNYQNAKQEQISKALSQLSSPFAKKEKGTPLVQYDPDKKVYLVANYDIKAKKDDKDAFFVHSEEDIVKEYTKKYPYFATLSPDMQREIIITRLGIEGQRARLEDEREKAINEAKKEGKAFDSAKYDAKFKVYDSAEKLTIAILDGSFSVAYDQRAFESVLDPEHKITRNLDAVENAGKNLSENIGKYGNLCEILENLPISEEERQGIKTEPDKAHSLDPNLDFNKALIEQIKPFMEREKVDGEKIYDIIARYSDIESPSANNQEKAKKAAGFTEFCRDKNQAIDRRTSINLTAARARYGKAYVDSEYRARKEALEKDIKYPTTVDLLAEILYDEEAMASRSPKIKAASKEEFMEKLAIKLNDTKPKDRENYIMSLLPKSYQEEYRQAKKHVLDELPSEENIEYFKANRDVRVFDINRAKYETEIEAILSGNLEADDLAKAVDKVNKGLVATGINEKSIDKLIKLLEDTSLDANEKNAKIEELKKGIGKELDIQKLRLENNKGRADAAREGETEDDRKANAEKYDLQKFQEAKAKYDTTLAAIDSYLAKNPDYPYGIEILNGFINGDISYFIENPEAMPEGIEIGNNDLYMFEILGINGDIKEIDKQINQTIDDKFTPEGLAKIRQGRLEESLKKAKKLQKQIEIQEKRLEDKQHHTDAARDGNSPAERKANAAKDDLERCEADWKEFEKKMKAIEGYIAEHPEYQYANDLINAFIDGDSAFFEAHASEFNPEGLNFGNLDLYLFEKLGIEKDIKKLRQSSSKKIDTKGLSPEKARIIAEKNKKANAALLAKIKGQKKKLIAKIREKYVGLKIDAEAAYNTSILATTRSSAAELGGQRSETLAKARGIFSFLSKKKADREAEAARRAEEERARTPERTEAAPEAEAEEAEGVAQEVPEA